MKRPSQRRTIILIAFLVVVATAWTQFSVKSPVYGWIGALYTDVQFQVRRALWKPPCTGEDWNWIKLGNSSVPVRSCYDVIDEYTATYSRGSSSLNLVACDPRSPTTSLHISAMTISHDKVAVFKATAHDRGCTVLRDNDPMVWECRFAVHYVLKGNQLVTYGMSTPDYITDVQRAALFAELSTVVDTYVESVQSAEGQET